MRKTKWFLKALVVWVGVIAAVVGVIVLLFGVLWPTAPVAVAFVTGCLLGIPVAFALPMCFILFEPVD